MSQSSSFGRLVPAGLAGFLAWLLASGCSTHRQAPQQIRAHTRIVQGIAHADPAVLAEHYCSYCHGQGLGGGANLAPTCFQCHGKTWFDTPGTSGNAPPDHATLLGGFRHKAGLFQPAANCSTCHGTDLSGQTTSNTAVGLTIPGCELCHTKLWDERVPPPGG